MTVAAHKRVPLDSASDDQTQYLTFMLGSEAFALGILSVKEIIEYGQLTEVPMMPPYVRGVINLRGAVVPVIDLAVRFGKEQRAVTKRTCIVIVETVQSGQSEDVGVVVDAVNAVLEIPADEVEPPPTFGANISSDFVHGLGKIDGKFVIILDAEKVLDYEQFHQLGEVIAAQQAIAL